MLGLQNEREWRAFCEKVLLQAGLATDARFDSNARRNENRDALRAIIVETFAALGTAQVLERLDAAQIANARMNDMAGLWAHPQLQARDRWRQVGSPAGAIPALLPAGRQSAFDYRMDPVPAVGEHTESILRSLGRRRCRHCRPARGGGGVSATDATSRLALARTFLFVPADRPERHARALASGAGGVIVDLEDAVAPDRKADGACATEGFFLCLERGAASSACWCASTPAARRGTTVTSREVGELAAEGLIAGVMLPKAERAADLQRLCCRPRTETACSCR